MSLTMKVDTKTKEQPRGEKKEYTNLEILIPWPHKGRVNIVQSDKKHSDAKVCGWCFMLTTELKQPFKQLRNGTWICVEAKNLCWYVNTIYAYNKYWFEVETFENEKHRQDFGWSSAYCDLR